MVCPQQTGVVILLLCALFAVFLLGVVFYQHRRIKNLLAERANAGAGEVNFSRNI
jgi:hypothetical protein